MEEILPRFLWRSGRGRRLCGGLDAGVDVARVPGAARGACAQWPASHAGAPTPHAEDARKRMMRLTPMPLAHIHERGHTHEETRHSGVWTGGPRRSRLRRGQRSPEPRRPGHPAPPDRAAGVGARPVRLPKNHAENRRTPVRHTARPVRGSRRTLRPRSAACAMTVPLTQLEKCTMYRINYFFKLRRAGGPGVAVGHPIRVPAREQQTGTAIREGRPGAGPTTMAGTREPVGSRGASIRDRAFKR